MEKQVELCSREVEMMASQHIQRPHKEKGGFVTMPFIMGKQKHFLVWFGLVWLLQIDGFSWFLVLVVCVVAANEALARVATFGLLPNMILYLMGSYHFHLAKATQLLLLSSATSNITPLVGAFIADSYLGRFLSVGLGSTITFLVLFKNFRFSAGFSVLFFCCVFKIH